MKRKNKLVIAMFSAVLRLLPAVYAQDKYGGAGGLAFSGFKGIRGLAGCVRVWTET
jgi:hypothetical protein